MPDGAGSVRLENGAPEIPLGPSELRVRMLRATINPADRLMIEGRYPFSDPQALGAEGVGEVTAIGSDVADLSPGDRVLPLPRGNWTMTRTLDRTAVVKIAATLPLHAAAALRINPATAARLLLRGDLARGDWLIQNAARSTVATWVRRLAEDRGLRVIDVVRHSNVHTPSEHLLVEDGSLSRNVAKTTGGQAVRLALDCVAGRSTGRLASVLADRGRLIVFGHLSGQPCSVPSTLLTRRGLTVDGFSLRPDESSDRPDQMQAFYDALGVFAAEGLSPEPDAIYPLTGIADALAASRAGSRVQIDLAA